MPDVVGFAGEIALHDLDSFLHQQLAIAQATKEFGEYLSAVSTAVADHVVTPNELRRIDRELGEHQAAVNRLRAVCAALLPKGRSR